jgi:AhpD family alkylhydroperoxidase
MNANNLDTPAALKNCTDNSSLSKREQHLIGLAVTLTRGCKPCSTRRFTEAVQSGISKQELADLTDLVALTNAGVVIRTALDSWDSQNDSICQDEICSVN